MKKNYGWCNGRPNTMRTKNSLWKTWVKPFLKPDGSNLDKVVNLWEQQLQPNSVKSILYIAKAWVEYRSGKLLDVRAHVKRVGRSQQQKLPTALNKKEIVALTRACKASDPELYLPFMLGLHTGCRRGEVWGLQWGDVDILGNKIMVSKSYKGPTKSGKSRIVPISYALEKVLLAHVPVKGYNCLETVVSSIFDPNPRLKRACILAQVPVITFHSLRHSFATLALEAGRSPRLVSAQLGHSKVSTTLDLYWAQTQQSMDLGFLPNE